jgi:S-formylglutathione hydrolase FrmB
MRHGWLITALCLLAPCAAHAHILPRPLKLNRVNRKLHGKVIDHTVNHGRDNRIWSEALGEKRDLYVYVPPGYDPCKKYPFLLLLHGFNQDEAALVDHVVAPIDKAIACGQLPPMILAAPDGSLKGLDCFVTYGTFFTNNNKGKFEDYLLGDVLPFVLKNYSVRPEPEARVLAGVSMGGAPAFTNTMRRPDLFKNAVAVLSPLNLRWISCRGRYMDNFDPCCWGWRTDWSRRYEVIGRFYGVITIPQGRFAYPLYGRDSRVILERISAQNPIELLDSLDVKPGQFNFYVGYARHDEFNLDAQAESFLHRAREKGIEVTVGYDPNGRHNPATALRLLPGVIEWLNARLAPYAPK